ncbi:MAG: hypothetical protein JO112_23025 [Planctomycetes bacterium]|nr:hypothetical protein [Planctomycetota bacterium]
MDCLSEECKMFARKLESYNIFREFLGTLPEYDYEVFKMKVKIELHRQCMENGVDIEDFNSIKSIILLCAYEDYLIFDNPSKYIKYLESLEG